MKGSEANRVDKFTKLFQNLLNRRLYDRSVPRFHEEKCDVDMEKILCNFMQQEHICGTCDLYLKKKKMPPHAVCNKLNIQTFPCELKSLNRFESVLISRRLLFNKVKISPK